MPIISKIDLNVLILEDDSLDAELNKNQLDALDEYNCFSKIVNDKVAFLEQLKLFKPDIILSDYNLPNFNGLQALAEVQTYNPLIPFIIVTGALNEEVAAQTIKSGAWDYVMKDRLFRLPHVIRAALQLREEKLKNLKIQEQNAKLSKVVEQSPLQIMITDTQGNLEYVNERFYSVTGYSADDLLGAQSNILKSGQHSIAFYKELWDTISSGKIWKGEFLNKKSDGSLFWESASISPLISKTGEIINYIAIKEDITARKNLEKELIKARDFAERANQLKTAFIQNLSHEICTPLNAIVGFSSLLNDSDITIANKNEYVDIILKSSNQLLAVINDILTISRIQTGEQEIIYNSCNLNAILNSMFLTFNQKAQEKKLLLITQTLLQDGGDFIITDERIINEILSNLLSNAIKFTHTGTVEFGYKIKRDFIEFFVKDSGIGIENDKLEAIFERFSQADITTNYLYGGIGLGLTISKSYVEMLGGKIWVTSTPNAGSVFYFTIPYKPDTSITQHKLKIETLNPETSKKILVVEDEYFNYMLIKEILKKTNFDVVHVSNGVLAIEYCKANPDVFLILMDIKMPEMDGITAYHKIRELNVSVPIIAQTAYSMQSEKIQILNEGFTDYISKPINKKELLSLIEIYITGLN